MTKKKYRFDFAISCAGAQEDIARDLRDALVEKGFKVFFYKDFEHEVFGGDGKKFFQKVYSDESRYCIALISKEYNKRTWTKLERKIIEARELKSGHDILLPVLISGYKPRWLLKSRIYFNLKKRSHGELVKVLAKMAKPRCRSFERKPPRKTVNCDDYQWDKLFQLIKNHPVIPVIGQGLYSIETKKKEKRLLYDFLVQKVVQKSEARINYTFAKACADFLDRTNYGDLELEKVLTKALGEIQLPPKDSLWKLARIKHFNIFLTTAYDNFLAETIQKVRKLPVEILSYTSTQSELELPNNELLDNIRNSSCSLVCHLLGKLGINVAPVYRVNNIRETLEQFLGDMREDFENNLFKELKNSCFLFLGFKPDDVILQSFIPDFVNWLSGMKTASSTRLFIGGILGFNENKSIGELLDHLSTDEIEIIDSMESEDFVDCLFKKLEKQYPEAIIGE